MHVVCPHCQSPIEVIDISSHEDIACPSCGSTFRLEHPSTTNWRPQSGQTIGRFELIETVGHGAYGTVYKARDPELDRVVAIKAPRVGNIGEPEDLDRFLREARSAAQLRHSSIIPIHEVGQDDGVPYLVSDFVQGLTLADVLSGRRPSPREAAEMTVAIADALDYAHEQGVVHRDIKPSNIMIGDDGRPYVMDFGLAKRDAGEITMTVDGQILGTPAYMSPEQAKGESHSVDGRSDIYSLGVVLYQMVTGELPFRGTARMLLHQVLHDEPPSPRKLNGNLSRDLETICLKCMEKEPAQRYSTAGELAAELRRYLKGEAIHARPVGKAARIWRWSKRNPVVAALTAAVVFLLVAGTSLSTYFAIEANVRAQQAEDFAKKANDNATRAKKAEKLAGEKADEATQNERLAQKRLAAGSVIAGDGLLLGGRVTEARDNFRRAWDLAKKLNLSVVPATTGLLASYEHTPPPLLGDDGELGNTAEFAGHTAAVQCIDVSADGRLTVSGSNDKTIRLWDTFTGINRKTFRGHSGNVNDVAFLPDGNHIISGSEDTTLKLWDIRSGQLVRTFTGHSKGVHALAVTPDGKFVASGSANGELKLWEIANGKVRRNYATNPDQRFRSLAISPDGTLITGGGWARGLRLWEIESGRHLRTFPMTSARGVHNAVFSPDGRYVAAGEWGNVRIWDVQTAKQFLTWPAHANNITCVAYAPEGNILLTGSRDKNIKLWQIATKSLITEFNAHSSFVEDAEFIPKSNFVISCGFDKTIKLWQRGGHREILDVTAKSSIAYAGVSIETAAIAPDNRTAGCLNRDASISYFDLATGQEIHRLRGHTGVPQCLAFSPNGRSLVSAGGADKTLILWDLRTGKRKLTFVGHRSQVFQCIFSTDGRKIISASNEPENAVKIWNADTSAELHSLTGHKMWINSMAVTKDDRTLFTASGDDTLKIWDVRAGKLKVSLPMPDGCRSFALAPDNRTALFFNRGGEVSFWDVATQRTRYSVFANNMTSVTSTCFGPKSRCAYIGFRGTVTIFDVDAAKEIRSLSTVSHRISGLDVSHDGQTMLTAGALGYQIWDLSSPEKHRKRRQQLVQAQQTLRDLPDDAEALATFGRWYAFRGADRPAIEFLNKARSKGASISSLTLARAYWRLGQHKDAMREFRRALQEQSAPAEYLKLCLEAVKAQELPSFNGKRIVNATGILNVNDQTDLKKSQGRFEAVHAVKLSSDKSYLIDAQAEFDTLLRVEDADNKPLVANDDRQPPFDLNSRIVFTPASNGNYHLVVSSYDPKQTGLYTLTVREIEKAPTPKVLTGKLTKKHKLVNRKHYQFYRFTLTRGMPYTIEVESKDFDSYVVLIDPVLNKELSKNDDVAPKNRNARIDFTPYATRTYGIFVTTALPNETGAYALRVQRYGK